MLTQEFTAHVGTITMLDNILIKYLQERFHGEIIRPSDAGYDDARTIWNAMIDKHPALIARCADSDDVIEAVNSARYNNLLVSVRGSDHNVAGNAVCDGGLMIGLTLMKDIHVDPERSTATTPQELGAMAVFRLAPPAPCFPEGLHGKPVLAIMVCSLGDVEEGERVVPPLRAFGTAIFDGIKRQPFAAHNSSLDAGQPVGMNYYWKTEYVRDR